MMKTADAAAPAVMPMMSGLASGLRASDWKIAPEKPNAAPTSSAGQRPRQAQVVRIMKLDSSPCPKHRRDHVAQRDREVADAERDAEHDARRSATSTSRRPWSTTRAAARRARPAARTGRGARRRSIDEGRRQSSASFRRRTRKMKNGAPISAVTIPTCSSPGRAMTRPMTSAPSSRIGGQHHRVRQDPAVVRPGDRAGDVRDGQADERDRARRGRRRADEQHDRERRTTAGPAPTFWPSERATSSPSASAFRIRPAGERDDACRRR